jgi:hypothetical protein
MSTRNITASAYGPTTINEHDLPPASPISGYRPYHKRSPKAPLANMVNTADLENLLADVETSDGKQFY